MVCTAEDSPGPRRTEGRAAGESAETSGSTDWSRWSASSSPFSRTGSTYPSSFFSSSSSGTSSFLDRGIRAERGTGGGGAGDGTPADARGQAAGGRATAAGPVLPTPVAAGGPDKIPTDSRPHTQPLPPAVPADSTPTARNPPH